MLDVERERYNEGNLARRWERRIHDMPAPKPRLRRRRLSGFARTVYWIGGMWLAALVVTLGGVHVMQMAYQVDSLNAQYSSLVNRQESLAMEISSLTTPQVLEREAAKYHVTLHTPKVLAIAVQAKKSPNGAKRGSGGIGRMFNTIKSALVGR